MDTPNYKRIMLKLSGEALAGEKGNGFDFEIISRIADEIKDITALGVEVGMVIGGGNIWRGRDGGQMERTTADYMGMLATCINALAVQSELENHGVDVRVQTSIQMIQVAEPYTRRRAEKHLSSGKVVIFAGGTGNPFFSTDTAAALRAAEIRAEAILLAKKVDGVYDSDPNKNKDAVKFDRLTFTEVLERDLKVMDSTATSLCRDNNIPILVFALDEPGNIKKALTGEAVGTIVSNT